jgi:hypothetical protein
LPTLYQPKLAQRLTWSSPSNPLPILRQPKPVQKLARSPKPEPHPELKPKSNPLPILHQPWLVQKLARGPKPEQQPKLAQVPRLEQGQVPRPGSWHDVPCSPHARTLCE